MVIPLPGTDTLFTFFRGKSKFPESSGSWLFSAQNSLQAKETFGGGKFCSPTEWRQTWPANFVTLDASINRPPSLSSSSNSPSLGPPSFNTNRDEFSSFLSHRPGPSWPGFWLAPVLSHFASAWVPEHYFPSGFLLLPVDGFWFTSSILNASSSLP